LLKPSNSSRLRCATLQRWLEMPWFCGSSLSTLSRPFSPKRVLAEPDEPEASNLLQGADEKPSEDPKTAQADQTPSTEATASPFGLGPLFAAVAAGVPGALLLPSEDSAEDGKARTVELAEQPLEETGACCHNASAGDLLLAAEDDQELQKRIVKLHVYHTDPYTAFLNRAGLKYADVPIYHVGVEVYGTEWAFSYFDDCWDNPSFTGVWPAQAPMRMDGFEYQETIIMGPTALDSYDTLRVVEELRAQWPSCAYHITRNNCLTFAQELTKKLGVTEPFPKMLVGFGNCPEYLPKTDAIVNFGWEWYKWSMLREAAAANGAPAPALPNNWLTACCTTPQIS